MAWENWRCWTKFIAAGGRMFAQAHSRTLDVMFSFEARTPFDTWDHWRDIRALPLEEQKVKLRDPAVRAKLLGIADNPEGKAFPQLLRWPRHASAGLGPDTHHGHAGRCRSAPDVRRCGRAWHPPRGAFHRSRARNRSQGAVAAPCDESEPGSRAGDHEASAHGGNAVGFRRPRRAAHGQLAAEPRPEPLGACGAEAHDGRSGAVADLRHLQAVGPL